jgi:GTP-binding protein HflX
LQNTQRTDFSVQREKAVLVGVHLPPYSDRGDEPLAELASLAKTAGAKVVGSVVQRRQKIDPAFYIGKGKAQEVRNLADGLDADVLIFDNDLSPAQIRELETIAERKILDRSELILDIFASRAKTHEARLQVELAQLEYTAPRLRGMWTHLERIAGAGGGTAAGSVGGIGTRGPGERQIEIDRRLVNDRIAHLKKQLRQIDKRRVREVKSRQDFFSISLVGYTNAGKSTLMNALTGTDVLTEDKLFATLDTKTSKWNIDKRDHVLLSDTVGFIQDLPHHLVASFRATLEETIHANLLLHVVDGSSPEADAQFAAVNGVLNELGCADIPTIVVMNKADAAQDDVMMRVFQYRQTDPIAISAKTGQGLEDLVTRVQGHVRQNRTRVHLRLHVAAGKALAEIDQHAEVLERHYDDTDVHMTISISQAQLSRLLQTYPSIKLVTTPDDPACSLSA